MLATLPSLPRYLLLRLGGEQCLALHLAVRFASKGGKVHRGVLRRHLQIIRTCEYDTVALRAGFSNARNGGMGARRHTGAGRNCRDELGVPGKQDKL